ncbi:MAG: hypothetical protein ABI602_00525 [Candidatus Saccharibacteria bacterium]
MKNNDRDLSPLRENVPLHLTRRGKIARWLAPLALLTTAAVGLAPTAVKDIEHLGHAYTKIELDLMPKVQVVVHPGMGSNEVVNGVDPDIGQDAYTDVNDYVTNQGTVVNEYGDRVLRDGQAVEVPVLPGQTPNQPTK